MGIPGRQNGVGKTLGQEGAWRLCAPAGSRGPRRRVGVVCVCRGLSGGWLGMRSKRQAGTSQSGVT